MGAVSVARVAAVPQQHSLYKTELCRSWEETGTCRYGAKCQFSHGRDELRPVLRHPKYKTEVCRTFAQNGTCPYGTRCRFIHQRAPTKSVLGTLVAGAHAVIPSDWRPEGNGRRPGAEGQRVRKKRRNGSGRGEAGAGLAADGIRKTRRVALPIFQRIAADEEDDEGDERRGRRDKRKLERGSRRRGSFRARQSRRARRPVRRGSTSTGARDDDDDDADETTKRRNERRFNRATVTDGY